MPLFESANEMTVARGYSLRELSSRMEHYDFMLWMAAESHPFYGTSIAFVAEVDTRGVFASISLHSSGIRGYYALRVIAMPLPSHCRIVEVINFSPEENIVSSHDVRTAKGVKKLRETLHNLGDAATAAAVEVASTVLAKTLNIRRAFVSLAATLPPDLVDLDPVLVGLRSAASESEKRIARQQLPSPLRLPFNNDEELRRVKESYDIASLLVASLLLGENSGNHVPLQPEEREDCVELLASWVFNPWLFQKLNVRLPIWNDI